MLFWESESKTIHTSPESHTAVISRRGQSCSCYIPAKSPYCRLVIRELSYQPVIKPRLLWLVLTAIKKKHSTHLSPIVLSRVENFKTTVLHYPMDILALLPLFPYKNHYSEGKIFLTLDLYVTIASLRWDEIDQVWCAFPSLGLPSTGNPGEVKYMTTQRSERSKQSPFEYGYFGAGNALVLQILTLDFLAVW